ncbi:transporter substrate-binding domain-containing protein [uncultured Anaerofustis sp.]|uniref:ATP-binding protein n=1 Tax=uncultured Anaerofustis sp. TaxID=904996 RepID=UPI0025E57DBB|nr:transporter substrate-binding domain-containing protein [uncultured Anaerofustis sp.]
MRHLCKKIGIGILAVIISLLILYIPTNVFAKEAKVLKVAFPESPGINEVYEDGSYGGSVYEWLMEISKYTGLEYEFVTGDADTLLSGMMKGKYDIMGGMLYQKELEKYFSYPKYSMGSNYSLLIYPKDDESIKSFDLRTLNGKTIGVYEKADYKIERLKIFLDSNNIKCKIKYLGVDKYESCLENKEVDLMLGSDVYMKDHYNVAAKFAADPYYIVTSSKQKEICKELSNAMEEIYAANPNFADELYNKYFPEQYINTISFSKSDLSFIKNAGEIKVAVSEELYPISYKDKEVNGIIPDIIKLISKKSGLKFTYVTAKTYEDAINLVKDGKADILGGFFDDSYFADQQNLILTKSYINIDGVILKNKNADTELENITQAVIKGGNTNSTDKKIKLEYYDSFEDCLDAVNKGEVSQTIMPSSIMESLYLKNYYPNVIYTSSENAQPGLSLALKKGSDPELYNVLNKTVNNISEAEAGNIKKDNMVSIGENKVSFKSYYYSNPTLVIVIIVGFIVLISIIVILFIWFKMRNNIMQVKVEEAEASSKAKSEFLSLMSHEIRTPINAIIGLTNINMMNKDLPEHLKKNLAKIDSSAQFLLSLVNDILDMSKIQNYKMIINNQCFDMFKVTKDIDELFISKKEEKNIKFTFDIELKNKYFMGDSVRIKQIISNIVSNAFKFTEENGEIILTIREEVKEDNTSDVFFSIKDNGIGIKEDKLNKIFDAFEQVSINYNNEAGTGLGLFICNHLVTLMDGELKVESKEGEGSDFYFTLNLPIVNEKDVEEEISNNDISKLEDKRILIAEDNDLNAEIVISLLEMNNIKVDRASNGEEAVKMFKDSEDNHYDMILMDIKMPKKDGIMTTKEIRSIDSDYAKQIPIIAMTANTFEEDRKNALNAGMNAFLSKPFNVDEFYKIISDTK